MFLQEEVLVDGQRLATGHLVDDRCVVDGESGGVHAAEDCVEALLVLDVVHELGEAHELGAVQLLNDEGVEVVAALLAVADDVDAGVLLVL